MTPFEKAMDEYFEHFGIFYPYAVGHGYPGKTDEENIEIIQKCIADDKPIEFQPNYLPERLY